MNQVLFMDSLSVLTVITKLPRVIRRSATEFGVLQNTLAVGMAEE